MSAPSFDEIEGEEEDGAPPPSFDEIEGEPGVGAGRAAALGTAQYGTMGHADEFGAKVVNLLENLGLFGSRAKPHPNLSPELAATFDEPQALGDQVKQRMRDEARAAASEQPGAYHGAGLATSLVGPGAGNFLPGMGGSGQILSAVGQGALTGAGASEADSAGGVAQDALHGGIASGAIAGAAHGVGQIPGALKAGARSAKATGVAANKAALNEAAESKLGTYRNLVQQGSRDLEVLGREADQLAQGTMGNRPLNAARFMESPGAQRLRNVVVEGKLESAPKRIEQIGKALQEFKDASAVNQDEVAHELFAGQVKGLPKAALEAGKSAIGRAAIGGLLGGVTGAVEGGLGGGLAGAGGGAAAGVLVGTPQGRYVLGNLGSKATAPLSVAAPLGQKYLTGPDALRPLLESLRSEEPEPNPWEDSELAEEMRRR